MYILYYALYQATGQSKFIWDSKNKNKNIKYEI